MWSCRRSLSTVTTLAFEQLDECLIFDTPFYAPYLRETGLNEAHYQETLAHFESDYQKVIQNITGKLPENKSFTFQRHIAYQLLPKFGRDWLKLINHLFLIRTPQEMIFSYQRVKEKLGDKSKITAHEVGLEALYNLFIEIRSITGKTPLVIDAEDLSKDPRKVLQFICQYFNIDFSERMMGWEPNLRKSQIAHREIPSASETWIKSWYSTVNDSRGFLPKKQRDVELTDDLIGLVNHCEPFYQKLHQYRHIFV